MIWDMEFKVHKTLYTREQIRQEYDQSRSRLEILKSTINKTKEKGGLQETNIDEFKRLEDEEVRLNAEIERKVAQMKHLDVEIQGSKPNETYPEGHQGINETIEGLRELQEVTKQYIKTL